MDLIDISGQSLLFGLVATVIIIALHGFSIAAFARLLGDPGPTYDARLTLNPLAHLEIVGALALVLTPLGWIHPPVLEADKLRGGIAGALAVVLLSLGTLLVLAWGLWMLRPVLYGLWPGNVLGTTLIGLSETTARKAIGFALFNLIPILPLTAGMIWSALSPRVHALQTRALRGIAIALAVLIVLGLPQAVIAPAIQSLSALLLG